MTHSSKEGMARRKGRRVEVEPVLGSLRTMALAVWAPPLWIVVLHVLSAGWVTGEYLGCFEDSQDRLMPDYRMDLININSPARCVYICGRLGHRFAGLEVGKECFCSDKRPSEERKKSDNDCHFSCPNSNEKCGGSWRLSVYSVDPYVTPLSSDSEDNGTYVGCFEDSGKRLLSDFRITFHEINTPRKCVRLCKALGFEYSGVENGNECFCGKRKPSEDKKKSKSDCKASCPRSKEKCGAPWRISVYRSQLDSAPQTNITDETVSKAHLGCFEDDGKRLLADFRIELHDINSPKKCMYLCQKLGFDYAGLEVGIECFCGNRRPSNDTKKSEADCQSTCPNSEQKCGGSWRLSVYSLKTESPETEASTSGSGGYLGCFEDSKDRLLSHYRTDLKDINSPKKCIHLCEELGYQYAGLENGNECFCGRQRPGEVKRRNENDCQTSCPNSEEKCGGFWRLGVYETNAPPRQPESDVNVNQRHLGCFEDSTDRILSHYRTDLNDINSPEKCFHLCEELGYKYAGVENGNECFCGNERPGDDKKRSEEDCGTSCPNSKEKCGGFWRLSAYTIESPPLDETSEVDLPESKGNVEYLGCYEDSRRRLLSDYRMDLAHINSPEKCVYICGRLGYRYAGMEIGKECFCGDKKPTENKKRSDVDCRTICPHGKENCGGSWRLSVYSTNSSSPPSKGSDDNETYLGCYEDSGKRLLPDFQMRLNGINNPKKCVRVCKALGFGYSGVENGNECFCGKERPSEDKKKNEKDCQTSCPYSKKKCGGSWRLSVYSHPLDHTSQRDITNETVSRVHLGCYEDNEKRLLSDFRIDLPDVNSPKKCLHICQKLGYNYAGVEYGFECFCGNSRPSEDKKRSEYECWRSCPDTCEKCGGIWKLSVYSVESSLLDVRSTPCIDCD